MAAPLVRRRLPCDMRLAGGRRMPAKWFGAFVVAVDRRRCTRYQRAHSISTHRRTASPLRRRTWGLVAPKPAGKIRQTATALACNASPAHSRWDAGGGTAGARNRTTNNLTATTTYSNQTASLADTHTPPMKTEDTGDLPAGYRRQAGTPLQHAGIRPQLRVAATGSRNKPKRRSRSRGVWLRGPGVAGDAVWRVMRMGASASAGGLGGVRHGGSVARVQGQAGWSRTRAASGPVPGRGLPGPVCRADAADRPGGLGVHHHRPDRPAAALGLVRLPGTADRVD